jgi:hypothetical protein
MIGTTILPAQYLANLRISSIKASGLEEHGGRMTLHNSRSWPRRCSYSGLKSEHLKLLAPFGRRIAKPLNAYTAEQATFQDLRGFG